MAVALSNSMVSGADETVLSTILQPDVSLAIWDRPASRTLLDGMAGLCPAHLPQGRVLVWLPDVSAALASIVAETPIGATVLGRALLDDMLMLVRHFAAIAGTDIVDIRLDRLRHDACWKFHRDQVRLRLLTTYRGPATQIVPQAYAEEALRAQRAYRGPLADLSDGAVALFKGTQAGPDTGVVHRSPPIAGTGTVRSLFCLNLPSDTSPRLWEP
ncbi:DUF1826 domain-containing protein [Niveispirillum sp.]|uniref:DUF1826 domain-containing protein n=1 Tax=Niveispirillum sp. TaxID=1917217 RepID=UPI001B4315C4|nr:DUF1826 domain-containing protein [Niveispirillum sp.]MBP7339670.1 DUF1826 domain-containing protein [Niveispirillum sp.]